MTPLTNWLKFPEVNALASKIAGGQPVTLFHRKLAAFRVINDEERRARIKIARADQIRENVACSCGSCTRCKKRARATNHYLEYDARVRERSKLASRRSRQRRAEPLYDPRAVLPSAGMYGAGESFPNYLAELSSVIQRLR